MPFEAGSHRLLPALLSTKPLPAGSVELLVLLHPPADLFFASRRVMFLFGRKEFLG